MQMIDLETKIAKALWHRFGNPNVVEWEDETHKAEYLDAVVQVLFIAAARIEQLEAALRPYVTDFCEGWCKDSPPNAMFDDCSGCRARAALAPEQDK
jgi:hypothetical protein